MNMNMKQKVLRVLYFCINLFHMFIFNFLTCWKTNTKTKSLNQTQTFSLPSPLPPLGQGQGFASGVINLGEIEVCKVTTFEFVWGSNDTVDKKKAVAFFKPVEIPDGFHVLGHYCQPCYQPFRSFLLVAREVEMCSSARTSICNKLPALMNPLDYTLLWCYDAGSKEISTGSCYCWLPQPPVGYKALGYLVTNDPNKPELVEMSCVRADLTDKCEPYQLILDVGSVISEFPIRVWNLRPLDRGMLGKGVSVGTFFCSTYWNKREELPVWCLKNFNTALPAMPSLDQINALIEHYGPTVLFHPKEVYLPSSVNWFFTNGAQLYRKGVSTAEAIDATGSNLPGGGTNDGEFWIDLPSDDRRDFVKHGDLTSAKLYVHVKPALSGTFTDIAMWVFCPFNGPSTLKFGVFSIPFSKVGEHVGDWEHFTLRICNFNGELWSIYFSQHSKGKWVDAYDLEYIDGNKAIVYSSKSGHASYPHPGTYIQGSSKLGIGIRNDCSGSSLRVDSSIHYEVVAAEYLGDVVKVPQWLQFMREWGPKIVYDSKNEVDKLINALPFLKLFKKLPVELYGEQGPTGPKQKNNWIGDERW
ncbi:putative vacuolar protein sorting-associated protein [Lupinus albus]|uniref:Putative vacuolar protein sorting-associated protein n=1 Tax=Lupinus albus TaxID=3870 RepID=A0A6A4PY90_LUPAL|nr:putative vacuolar protein sorting-associated protein [Lupinus albus]